MQRFRRNPAGIEGEKRKWINNLNLDSSRDFHLSPAEMDPDASPRGDPPKYRMEWSDGEIEVLAGAEGLEESHVRQNSEAEEKSHFRNHSQSQIEIVQSDETPGIPAENQRFVEIDWANPAEVIRWMDLQVGEPRGWQCRRRERSCTRLRFDVPF